MRHKSRSFRLPTRSTTTSNGRPGAGEVLTGVVDDLGRPERRHQVDVAGATDAGHGGPADGSKLYGEGAHAARCPDDQHPLAGQLAYVVYLPRTDSSSSTTRAPSSPRATGRPPGITYIGASGLRHRRTDTDVLTHQASPQSWGRTVTDVLRHHTPVRNLKGDAFDLRKQGVPPLYSPSRGMETVTPAMQACPHDLMSLGGCGVRGDRRTVALTASHPVRRLN